MGCCLAVTHCHRHIGDREVLVTALNIIYKIKICQFPYAELVFVGVLKNMLGARTPHISVITS